MYAMNVARFHRFPESRQKGSWALPRLALFTSREVRERGLPAPGWGDGKGTGFGIGPPLRPRSDPRLLPAQSHYSIQKGAAFLGIGTDNVRLVGTDER